jgi:hypothetical protein
MVARARFASRSRRVSGIPQASRPGGQQDEELAQEAHMRRSAPAAPEFSRARPFGRRPDLCWFFQRVSPYKLDNISIIHHHFPAVRTLQSSCMKHDGIEAF